MAFHSPVVNDAIAASAFFESGQLREHWGDDPPNHLPQAVARLQRAQNATRGADYDAKSKQKNNSGKDNP